MNVTTNTWTLPALTRTPRFAFKLRIAMGILIWTGGLAAGISDLHSYLAGKVLSTGEHAEARPPGL